MSIYQFLIVVGRSGTEMLTNEAGEVTSHLQGMFARTIRLLEAGIKPVYVFDGKPPDLKKQELAKRQCSKIAASSGRHYHGGNNHRATSSASHLSLSNSISHFIHQSPLPIALSPQQHSSSPSPER